MAEHHDPVTGDKLSNGEWASWQVQKIIRNWLFLGLITAITAYVWLIADPIWRHPITDQWNLWASYLALVIEGVTAMALIQMSRRDSAIIRLIKRTVEQEEREIHAMTNQPARRSTPPRDPVTGRFVKRDAA